MADPAWKAENFTGCESEWRSYDTFYMSMGQGYNSYTPLQMACSIATIANNGTRMQPYLVETIVDPDGNEVYHSTPTIADQLEISSEGIQAVKEAMRAVCQPGGTAYRLFSNFPVEVAGKTGTAQTGLPGDDKNEDYHGLFVAFAPYDDPEVAFAGIIEYGYHGGTSAGQVCKDVFSQYFGVSDIELTSKVPLVFREDTTTSDTDMVYTPE